MKTWEEMFIDLRKNVESHPGENQPLYAFKQIGLLNDSIVKLEKEGQVLDNTTKQDIKRFYDEMAEIGKDFIYNKYFNGYDESKRKFINIQKVYETAYEEYKQFKDNPDKNYIWMIVGRTYTIHYLFEDIETPKAREVYYKILGGKIKMSRLRDKYKKDDYKNFLMKQGKTELVQEILELEKEISVLKTVCVRKGNGLKVCQV